MLSFDGGPPMILSETLIKLFWELNTLVADKLSGDWTILRECNNPSTDISLTFYQVDLPCRMWILTWSDFDS